MQGRISSFLHFKILLNLSRASFLNTDITRVRFGERIVWGGTDGFTIYDEKRLEYRNASLESVIAVYRNLRENYEYRLRFDAAGRFFIKEMELKRKYKEVFVLKGFTIQKSNWFIRNFSLNGLYYHLAMYGESLLRPTILSILVVLISTFYWSFQTNQFKSACASCRVLKS